MAGCTCHQGGTVLLTLQSGNPDGSMLARSWTITRCAAESLAERLGTPDAESLSTAEAVADAAAAIESHPGLTWVTQDRRGGGHG